MIMKMWVARNPDGKIGLYKGKPRWCIGIFEYNWNYGGFVGYLKPMSFPEVTFENSPQQVEIKLINNE